MYIELEEKESRVKVELTPIAVHNEPVQVLALVDISPEVVFGK